jgi:hypothetical protein
MFCDEVATMSSSLRIELISGIVIAIGISLKQTNNDVYTNILAF